ncbi:tyrosine-type recombinase/integrase [Citrobacter koseri]|uniref:tyrosine-type recombinase/integrase n=1 Tax=Citrobacter koseri TaxID=545 RepID=UPI002941C9AA|nr:tyrosine-type recombinase/integrase [Citrobacter koseri]WOJ29349.1 tyrosine-type recombinase/integrase [Citrobacter koseri]WOJ33523.1 tyrosine-type recombinase/integrase [Citrobacter koseri]
MASIKESTDANGQSKYYVHWKDERSGHGRRRIFKNIDDAAHLFWQKQNIELDCRTASWRGIDHSWTFRKLILFFLGYQANKLEKNIIRLSSYTKCRHDLLAVEGPILEKHVLHVSHRDVADSIRQGCHRWIRSAFFLLEEKRLITFNPVDRPVRRHRRPITIPSRETVRELLDTAPRRERIACWLGICGLRLGEALAVTYEDVSPEIIQIRRHIVNGVIREGLKRGVERQVRMPRELLSLLDAELFGTSQPLVANSFTEAPLSINYGTQGILQKTLAAHGIRRFHHLRHFAVSRLAARGVDITHVSRLIGHVNIKTTIDVYGHLFCAPVDMDLD